MTTIGTLARVLRSKNASPFRVTIDAFFDDADSYERVKRSGRLTAESVAKRYGLPLELVEGPYFVDQALGVKVTLMKRHPSDHFRSTDCYGAQQHLPFAGLEIDDE
jgi:hypothetical protein